MKKILILMLIVLASFTSFGEDGGLEKFNLKKIILTNEIIDKQPGEDISEFNLYSKGFLYTEFGDVGAEKTILHKWYFLEKNGEKTVMATIPLQVQGLRWRTWSSKNLFLSGQWMVEVINENNEVIAEKYFHVK